MAKIQTINKSRLRNNEWLAAGRAIELQIQTAGASALGVTAPFENFQKALQAYDDSLVKLTKSALTAEMEAADKKTRLPANRHPRPDTYLRKPLRCRQTNGCGTFNPTGKQI